MYENTNSHAALCVTGPQLHFLGVLVPARRVIAQRHLRKPPVVHRASHPNAILHALQLLLDVLRGRASPFSAGRRFCEGQRCDENFHIHRMGPADDLCGNLQLHEIQKRKREQTVSFIHEVVIIFKFFAFLQLLD